ncbi:ralBP1-associated Eps domain-containing protein 1 isoform X1 [Neocloeon triangulifer]|uniref:ralBP1-associated Eps domain-containing protein 1 isoform X1 n=1 Tax=Neocloeon triangulifer TaxID=2078957 RepID=UPI00286EF24E|nr:ralBP1-associated Eps domain-containing protein 1 isoform X1 [Neocloeon triangulifer]
MEGLQLSDTEQRYFGDLFICCDADNSGKVTASKATELFRTANLPSDSLKQIFELCGVGSSTIHYSRRQFYTALKLIAAAQAGMALNADLVSSGSDVPLPRFTAWTTETPEKQKPTRQHISASPDLIQLSDTDATPIPLTLTSSAVILTSDSEADCESNEPSHIPLNRNANNGTCSPEVSSNASDSPTPTNSVKERKENWANAWQGLDIDPSLLSEEQRQLLGTEEESSDRHSSDEEGVEDDEVWSITEEQREYYTNQFRALQPDPSGLVPGHTARVFFEKSRLPVSELRKIWQLSDVTKDGALSLDEFNTAMHLVVLRRNSIPLPDVLPSVLQPPLLNLSSPTPPIKGPPTTEPPPAPQVEDSPPSLSPPNGEPSSPQRSKEWTKFVDSPTSSVSSPGPKPVNFDFHKAAVEQDPKILHPVPLRVTPDSGPHTEEDGLKSPRRFENEDQGSPKKGIVSQNSLDPGDIRPIQRPQPKKPAAPGRGAIPPPPHHPHNSDFDAQGTVSGPTSLPPMAALPQGPKKEPPPPPPPRPYRTHTRSSSLDLNTLGKGNLLPPVVPPRVSPIATSPKKLVVQRSEGDVIMPKNKQGFADFSHFGDAAESVEAIEAEAPRKHGAFEVYRKPIKQTKQEEETAEAQPATETLRGYSVKPSELREHNMCLSRLCVQLGRELVSLQEEHLSLRLQIEALSSSGD